MSRKDRRRKAKNNSNPKITKIQQKNALSKGAIITLATISVGLFLFIVSVR